MNREIAVTGLYDVNNGGVWSGIPFFFMEYLRRRADILIHRIAPLLPAVPQSAIEKTRAYQRDGKRYLWTRDLEWARYGAAIATDKLATMPATNVVVLNPSDAAFLSTSLPITIIVDATWRQFADSYGPFEQVPICPETEKDAELGEKLAFEKAQSILCMTSWAALGVKDQYPLYESKIRVAPPGANLWKPPLLKSIKEGIDAKLRRPQRQLLFLGASPHRKGVDIAIESCAILRDRGLDIILNVAGFEMHEGYALPSFVRCHGRLNKEKSADRNLLDELFYCSDLFIFPTRAECAGIVLCEAAAYGIPVVTSGVGGSTDLVLHEHTGIVLGNGAHPTHYASAIEAILAEPWRYEAMAMRARKHFESHLNWDAFITQMLAGWE